MRRVCHALFRPIPEVESFEDFSRRYPWLVHLLQAHAAMGWHAAWLGVSVMPHHSRRQNLELYIHAIEAGRHSLRPRLVPRYFRPRCLQSLETLQPDVVHYHDMTSIDALLRLCQWKRRHPARRVVVQYHGGRPRRLFKPLYALVFHCLDAALFGDETMRRAWVRGGLPPSRAKLLFLASSVFRPADQVQRQALRDKLDLLGRPIFGWLAHLDPNKDPLTVLRAFSMVQGCHPQARLYMHYQGRTLERQCREFLAERPHLRERVHLRGPLPYSRVEAFLQAVDYFVQASHRETYGFSVVEAMACGALPIISNIPSFRLLSENGKYAILFPVGDASALALRLRSVPEEPDATARAAMVQWFQETRSYPVLVQRLHRLYAAPGAETEVFEAQVTH